MRVAVYHDRAVTTTLPREFWEGNKISQLGLDKTLLTWILGENAKGQLVDAGFLNNTVVGVAARFSNNSAILGYDMLNEPVGSEHRQLSPLFESVAKVIRKNDKEAILFLCPMYLLGNVRP